MPSIEQSERFGAAAFLGVPAFEAFVWALDTYARLELLVRLHDYLPPFLINPVTGFIFMCLGLGLLHLSQQRQLARVAKSASHNPLVNTFGDKLEVGKKPLWVIPVLVSFTVALAATPILAVVYSLSYKGTAPEIRLPRPPAIAYVLTPRPEGKTSRADKPAKQQPPIQVAPGGINIGHDNTGTAIVNNFRPPDRHLTAQQTAAIGQEAAALPPEQRLSVACTSDAKSQNYAGEIYRAIEIYAKDKLIQGPIVNLGSFKGRAPEGTNVCISQEESPTFAAAQKIATVLNTSTDPVNFTRCTSISGNEIRIFIGPL